MFAYNETRDRLYDEKSCDHSDDVICVSIVTATSEEFQHTNQNLIEWFPLDTKLANDIEYYWLSVTANTS